MCPAGPVFFAVLGGILSKFLSIFGPCIQRELKKARFIWKAGLAGILALALFSCTKNGPDPEPEVDARNPAQGRVLFLLPTAVGRIDTPSGGYLLMQKALVGSGMAILRSPYGITWLPNITGLLQEAS
jgi:hypothetical protein